MQIHGAQPCLHAADHTGQVQISVGDNIARRAVHHPLGNIEYAHDDVPGVGDNEYADGSFHDPLEKDEGFKIVQAVPVNDHLNQLIAHDGGQHHPGNRDDDVIRQALDHVEHAAVPALRRRADRARNIRHLAVDAVEQAVQVIHNAADQNVLDPLHDFV